MSSHQRRRIRNSIGTDSWQHTSRPQDSASGHHRSQRVRWRLAARHCGAPRATRILHARCRVFRRWVIAQVSFGDSDRNGRARDRSAAINGPTSIRGELGSWGSRRAQSSLLSRRVTSARSRPWLRTHPRALCLKVWGRRQNRSLRGLSKGANCHLHPAPFRRRYNENLILLPLLKGRSRTVPGTWRSFVDRRRMHLSQSKRFEEQ